MLQDTNKNDLQATIDEWRMSILNNIDEVMLCGSFESRQEFISKLDHECDGWFKKKRDKLPSQ